MLIACVAIAVWWGFVRGGARSCSPRIPASGRKVFSLFCRSLLGRHIARLLRNLLFAGVSAVLTLLMGGGRRLGRGAHALPRTCFSDARAGAFAIPGLSWRRPDLRAQPEHRLGQRLARLAAWYVRSAGDTVLMPGMAWASSSYYFPLADLLWVRLRRALRVHGGGRADVGRKLRAGCWTR